MTATFRTILVFAATIVFGSNAFAQAWTAGTSGTFATLRSVSFPGDSVLWAVGEGATILHSEDGGFTWAPQNGNNENAFFGVSFVDAQNGTITGGAGTILQSSDGGTQWNVIQTDYWMTYYHAFQLTSQTAFVCGQNTIFQPIVTWTTDGWNNQDSGIFYLDGNEGSARAIHALDPSILVCAVNVWDGSGGIARSVDGGNEWSTAATHESVLNAVDFNDSGIGIVVGAGGSIMRSSTSGATWAPVGSPVGGDLHAVHFADETTVYAVGDGGTVIKSIDSGENWTQLEAPTPLPLYGVSFRDAQHGVVVGEAGAIFVTTNGGEDSNLPPGDFARLAPEDEAQLDRAAPVVFQWTTSVDPDGDDIRYFITIASPANDILIEDDLADTIAFFDFSELELPDGEVEFTWSIVASDGSLETSATNGEGSFSFLPVNSVPDENVGKPEGFMLHAAYPNPFNSMTLIRYEVSELSEVLLAVYNLLGEEVAVLKRGRVTPGTHLAAWRGTDSKGQRVASGTYLVRLQVEEARQSMRVTFVK